MDISLEMLNEGRKEPLIEVNDLSQGIQPIKDLSYDPPTRYGFKLKKDKPRRFGNVRMYLYYQGNPIVVLGPNCIYIVIN